MYRDAWIEIDLDAYKYNIKKIIADSGKNLIAIIKANAYGCGVEKMYKAALEAGASFFGVSSLEEAIVLRDCGCDKDILILSFVSNEYIDIVKKYDLTLTTVSLDWIKEFILTDVKGIKIQIKLDTGMNRVGIKTKEDLIEGISLLEKNGALIEGIFTHFACSDDKDSAMTDTQYNRFKDLVLSAKRKFKWIHCSNSDAALSLKENFSNSVRVGISMFGINSYRNDLKNVIALKCKIINVKEINQGETISYGATYVAKTNEVIATVPIGYADGWIRKNQDRMVWIDGEFVRIVGRICMDQMMLKLNDKKSVGTAVELFGKHISLNKVAEELDTIPYEVITLLSDRLTKVYFEDGQYLENYNPRLNRSEEITEV